MIYRYHPAEASMYRIAIAGICILLLLCLPAAMAAAANELGSKSTSSSRTNWSPSRPGESPGKTASVTAASSSKASKRSEEKSELLAPRLASEPLAKPASDIPAAKTAFQPQNFGGQVVVPQVGLPTLTPQNCDPFAQQQALPPSSWFWVRAEYLMWWTQGAEVPPLVTTGGTGVLGQPGTTTLFGGNDELNNEWRSGGRLSAGIWLNPTQATGIEGNVFALQEETTEFQTARNAPDFIGRPFFNIQIPDEDARIIPGPGFTAGGVAVRASTELQGGELLLRQLVNQPARNPVAFLVGYRYMRLDDDLLINESQSGPGPNSVSLFDSFETENTFHGVDVGVVTELRRNRWTLELVGKMALGNTQSQVSINGATTTAIAPAAPVTTVGGLLAQSSNIGTFEQDDFAVIPELTATVGFDITDRWRAVAGYTFVYWSRVARAGDQIDRDLNLPLVPGPNTLRPQFAFEMTDFWAQGVNVGLEYAF
jgi:hypothetical protein